jgi:hypothetical protein
MNKVLEVALGARMDLVVGYSAGTQIDAAMEKGEVICRVTSLDVHFNREPSRPGIKTALIAISCSLD